MNHLLTRVRHSRAVGVVRYHLYRDVLLKFPRLHSCNICGWRGRLGLLFQPLARHYVRADRGTMACDLWQDITAMPFRDCVSRS